MTGRPTYAELLRRTDQPPGSTWGLFEEPDRGMANLAGPQEVLRGVATVTRGVTFSLDYPLDHFDPPVLATRSPLQHRITSAHTDARDDYVDNFWMQASSQIDGLRHRRHHEYGFYNGVADEQLTADSDVLGVLHWANHPIVGRGVVIDVAGFLNADGRPLDHGPGAVITPDDLDRALAWQQTEPRAGDCVLIHTGWTEWLGALPVERRLEVSRNRRFTGMSNTEETIAWFWDRQVALVGSDTMALEKLPAIAGSPYGGTTDPGMIHQDLIGLLGLPIGELWHLDGLVRDSHETGTWDCLLICKPLALRGGVGSPPNAVAIR